MRRSRASVRTVGTDPGPSGGFTGGGFWYLEKDLGTVTGEKVARRSTTRYCARRRTVRSAPRAVWAALDAVPGDPDALRADANAERIAFRPGLLPTSIRYTNRPSGSSR